MVAATVIVVVVAAIIILFYHLTIVSKRIHWLRLLLLYVFVCLN